MYRQSLASSGNRSAQHVGIGVVEVHRSNGHRNVGIDRVSGGYRAEEIATAPDELGPCSPSSTAHSSPPSRVFFHRRYDDDGSRDIKLSINTELWAQTRHCLTWNLRIPYPSVHPAR